MSSAAHVVVATRVCGLPRRSAWRGVVAAASLTCVAVVPAARAGAAPQADAPAPPQVLTLAQAVDLALKNYPAIRASDGQAAVARAGVDLARTAYLPRTDLLFQENRATRNNVAGLLLPQNVISSITGPVSAASSDSVWGSAVGALFSWDPFDFGVRHANVSVAEGVDQQASAGAAWTRLQVAAHAADAFLTAVAADEAVRSAQANVDRLRVVATSVATLVQNQLRPGADASRADAEVAAATVQFLRAQLAETTARATLAEAIGRPGQTVRADGAGLLQTLPVADPSPAAVETHPLVRAEQAAVATIQSREQALAHAYLPRITFLSAVSARGSVASGVTPGESAGAWPDTSNWAAGVNVSFSLFDAAAIRARRQIEIGNETVERARYDQTVQALRAQDARTTATLDTTRQIVAAIPAELTSARDAESRARARYDAGLGTMTEVAEAEHLLAQAEVDDASARLSVWQALLAQASARGDLSVFLGQVK